MTLPLIVTMTRADREDRARLQAILAHQEERSRQFAAVHALIEKYDGYQATRQRAEQAITEAMASLAIFTGRTTTEAKDALSALGGYILARKK